MNKRENMEKCYPVVTTADKGYVITASLKLILQQERLEKCGGAFEYVLGTIAFATLSAGTESYFSEEDTYLSQHSK